MKPGTMENPIQIAVIAGDGIGPEVIRETLKVAQAITEAFQVHFSFDELPYNADYYLKHGSTIPESAFADYLNRYNGIMLGAFGANHVPANYAEGILLGLRRYLDLYVNFRPVKQWDKGLSPLQNKDTIDFAVFRENTEGLYCSSGGILKGHSKEAVAVENSISTYKGVERIIRAAFEYAQANRKKSVTMVDKSNVLRYEGQLWMEIYREVGEQYPDLTKHHMYIDRACMELIRKPSQFDVIVTSNLFGDILSDIGGQIQGGLGMAPSANLNPEHRTFAGVFEPVHGSAPDIAGKGIANPIGAILSFGLMLDKLGLQEINRSIQEVVTYSIQEKQTTPDLNGQLSTEDVGNFITQIIRDRGVKWEKQ